MPLIYLFWIQKRAAPASIADAADAYLSYNAVGILVPLTFFLLNHFLDRSAKLQLQSLTRLMRT